MDEYSEIGLLLFDGLMRRDENDAIVPALAASVEYDPETYTMYFAYVRACTGMMRNRCGRRM